MLIYGPSDNNGVWTSAGEGKGIGTGWRVWYRGGEGLCPGEGLNRSGEADGSGIWARNGAWLEAGICKIETTV